MYHYKILIKMKASLLLAFMITIVTGCSQSPVMGKDTKIESNAENSSIEACEEEVPEMETISEMTEYTNLTVAGIGLDVPKDWRYEDISRRSVLGYCVYPERESSEKDGTEKIEICFVLMEDIASYPDPTSVVLTIAKGIKQNKDCINYYSKLISLESNTGLFYDCIFSERGIRQEGCLYSVSDVGVLSVLYSYPSDHDSSFTDEFHTMVDNIKIPEDSTIIECAEFTKARLSKMEADNTDNYSTLAMPEHEEIDGITADMGPGTSEHGYYKGLSANNSTEADRVAKEIADSIMSNPDYKTELQRVTAAAQIVSQYCSADKYGMDSEKYYRSPYGVFVAGVYTCAGSTRALGRILDFMGYEWIHQNEDQNRHQWCVLTIDGQKGFADGMAGIAGYGAMTNGMVLPDGSIIYFSD